MDRQLYQETGYKVYPSFGLASADFIGDSVVTAPLYWVGASLYPVHDNAYKFRCDILGSDTSSAISALDIYPNEEWYRVVISYDATADELSYRVVVDGSDVFTWTESASGFSFDTFAMWDYIGSSQYTTLQYFDNLWIGSTADYDAASPVEITLQPVTQLLDSGGGNVQFTIIATNATDYQWYKNNVAISPSNPDFSGADTNTLTVNTVSQADTGVYFCTASNAVFAADSDKAALAIKGLVAHYKFDEGSGTTAADSSDYGNDLNVIGAIFLTATGESVCLEAIGYGNKYVGGEDFNRDCEITLADFAIFAASWLDSNLYTTP